MKNMNDKTKKWLTVTGCLALCAVLVVLIGTQLQKEKPQDKPLPQPSSPVSDVTVSPPAPEKDIVVTPPEIPASSQPTNNGAVSSGTEQTIQGDPIKPTAPPAEKPALPENTDNKNPAKPPEYKPDTTVKEPAKPSKPSGGNSIPGFDNVPNLGENQVIEGKSDGDINKQVGTMD